MASESVGDGSPMATDLGDESSMLDYDIRDRLGLALDQLPQPDSVAGKASLDTFTDPEISVNGYGRISLPLTEQEAQSIIQSCHQAPFGKGSETVVDESVRKTWELGADQFHICGQGWERYMKAVMEEVARMMEIDARNPGFHAELYKMLLYEKGAMFKAHQDTEKVLGMFGTLVVCLPSPHTGGDVRIQHNGYTKTFHTSTEKQSFLWWYSDVNHEVLPIESGIRWVLTYNLVKDNPSDPLPLWSPPSPALEEVLSIWNSQIDRGKNDYSKLIHILSHQYTKSNVRLSTLKGRDLCQALALVRACDATNFSLLVAPIVREVTGPTDDHYDESGRYTYCECDDSDEESACECEKAHIAEHHDIHEVEDDSIYLSAVYDTNGISVTTQVSIEEDAIVQENPFGDEDLIEEEFSGHTGNEGVSATHWYGRMALVIIPSAQIVGLLNLRIWGFYGRPREDILAMLRYFVYRVRKEPSDSLHKYNLSLLCTRLVEGNIQSNGHTYPSLMLSEVMGGVLLVGDIGLANRALKAFKDVDAKTLGLLGRHIEKRSIMEFQRCLDQTLTRYKTLEHIHDALARLLGGSIDKDSLDRFRVSGMSEWALETLLSNLEASEQLEEGDVSTLLKICKICAEQGQGTLGDRVCATIKRDVRKTPFIICFLNRLWDVIQGQNTSAPCLGMIRTLLPEACKHFQLNDGICFEDPPPVRSVYGGASAARIRHHPINGEDIGKFLEHCHDLSFLEEKRRILTVMRQEGLEAHVLDLAPVFIACLRRIAPLMSAWSISYTDPFYRSLFQDILRTYVSKYVQREPTPPGAWPKRTVSCFCDDCESLNRFLQDHTCSTERFPVNDSRRLHLKDMLHQFKLEVETSTDYNVTERPFVVTKVHAWYEATLKAWKSRKADAEKTLKEGFDEETLKVLLDDKFDDIVGMRMLMTLEGQTVAAPMADEVGKPCNRTGSPKKRLRLGSR